MNIGIFQFNPASKNLDFSFVNIIEIGVDFIIIEQPDKYIRLDSDFVIRDCILTGDETVLMMFERDGKLWPLIFSELVPLEHRFLPPPNILEDEALYSDPEYCALLDEQRRLISEILCELEKQDNEKPFEELCSISEEVEEETANAKEEEDEEHKGEII